MKRGPPMREQGVASAELNCRREARQAVGSRVSHLAGALLPLAAREVVGRGRVGALELVAAVQGQRATGIAAHTECKVAAPHTGSAPPVSAAASHPVPAMASSLGPERSDWKAPQPNSTAEADTAMRLSEQEELQAPAM